MSRIRILPETVANRIAAGEVVERPASVVKELVENALDAGARSIRVEAESGGRRLIRISDDGSGMSHDDALLAFERHATSKLRTADDLLSIATLGFRGEALPSIAAVSRLTLETRSAEDPEGARVEFAGGRLVSVKPAGLPVGTTIAVADLFYCVPARRKFLKSDTTELGHIASLVTHYALAHPDKHFFLRTPTQEIINAAPVAALSDRVYQLFGRAALEEFTELEPVTGPFRAAITEPALEPGEESATLTVSGFVSRPETQRPNRNAIYVFVNGRLVRDRLILHALGEAYRNIHPGGVFPGAMLFLDLTPEEVDVNVHPAKVEVRFRHSQFVHDFTRDAVRFALSKARPIPKFHVAGAEGPEQSRRAAAASSANWQSSPARSEFLPPSTLGENAAPAESASTATAEFSGPPRAVIPTSWPDSDAGASSHFELAPPSLLPEPQRLNFSPGALPDFAAPYAPFPDLPAASAEPHSASMPVDTFAPPTPTNLAELKPIGQVSSSFIVAVNGEGLWIIDQHVAHERILFEKHLRARREGALTGQRLLVPPVVELSPRQLVTFEQIAEELRASGFDVEPIGPRSVAIQAAPADLTTADAEKLLREILDGVENESKAISIESLQAKIAASTACHAAIKVNMPLDQTKMEWLLEELARTETPMSCPHGRPVVLRYSLRDIERAFKRI